MRHRTRLAAAALALGVLHLDLVSAADEPAVNAAPPTEAAPAAKPVPAAEAKAVPAAAAQAAATDAAGDAGSAAIKAMLQGEDVRDFRRFCDEWMGKLRVRDRDNVAAIRWESRDGQVVGEHVAYGTERTCVAREEPGKDPIGRITYREIRYRRAGADPTAALAATGTILEQTEVTEIFRFAKGRWQY